MLYDDCYIPFISRELSSLTQQAKTNAPTVKNGIDRNFENQINSHSLLPGENIEYRFDDYVCIHEIRIIFDSTLERDYDNMPCNFPLYQSKYQVPESLVKDYKIVGETPDGEVTLAENHCNRQRYVLHKTNALVKSIRLIAFETYGAERCNVFALDVK
ncbi:hypothetical protein SDC9_168058 [bioreactor metagenome]|uniref:Uncharacterized protein n=1 Tax=bioreactor metagenome TaxID=1076179 RepID=A0A645G4F9_9ZZZZ